VRAAPRVRLCFTLRIAVNNNPAARWVDARALAGIARMTYTPGTNEILRFLSGAFMLGPKLFLSLYE